MKKWGIVFIVLFFAGLVFLSCSGDKNTTEPDEDTTDPIVTITNPVNDSEFSEGEVIILKADASDNKGLSKIEFYVDEDTVNTDTSFPYEFEWNTTGFIGSHYLFAKAYDSSNNIGSSDVITFFVITVADTVPPSLNITLPVDSAAFYEDDIVIIKADATDNIGVSKTEFFIDSILAFTDSISPYEYEWNTTGKLGTHKIKAKAFDKSSNATTSFEITVIINEKPDTTVPVVAITSPADYEDFLEGDIINIRANATDSSGILKVDFWVNGEYYLTDNDYPYECVWNSTGNLGYNVIYANAYDIYENANSSNAINIQVKIRPIITITSPNGSEVFQMGRSVNITWEDNITENVKIELIKGNVSILNIAESETSDGLFIWSIPETLEIASDYSIKISSILDGIFSDMSDTNFELSEAVYITLLQPDGGEILEAGSTCQILWQDNLAENVEIKLYKGAAFYSTIVSSVQSNGSFTWNVSSSIDYDSDYQIRISSIIDPAITGFSEANFSVIEPYFIKIISPNGGEDWVMGSTQTITWEDNIDGNVTIRLFKRDVQISEITNSTESNGIFNWTIPENYDEGYGYYVKISSEYDSLEYDDSDMYFYLPSQTTPQGMVLVKGGTYEMGDEVGDLSIITRPVHNVNVDDFYIGLTEITQAEWLTYMPDPGLTTDYGMGDNKPMYYVNWYRSFVYCNLRSYSEGLTPCYIINNSSDPADWGVMPSAYGDPNIALWDSVQCSWTASGYRLPTEAEWEYAARGGIYWTDRYLYSGSNNVADVAWCYDTYDPSLPSGVQTVATKLPNQLGIYDMNGNLWEACWDWLDGDYYQTCVDNGIIDNPTGPEKQNLRSARSGCWNTPYSNIYVRIASRTDGNQGVSWYPYSYDQGLRVVRKP